MCPNGCVVNRSIPRSIRSRRSSTYRRRSFFKARTQEGVVMLILTLSRKRSGKTKRDRSTPSNFDRSMSGREACTDTVPAQAGSETAPLWKGASLHVGPLQHPWDPNRSRRVAWGEEPCVGPSVRKAQSSMFSKADFWARETRPWCSSPTGLQSQFKARAVRAARTYGRRLEPEGR